MLISRSRFLRIMNSLSSTHVLEGSQKWVCEVCTICWDGGHEMKETEWNCIKLATFCPPVGMLAGLTWTHDIARVKKSECRNSNSSTQKKVTDGWDSLRDVKKSEHELFDSFRFLLSLRPTFLEGRDAGGLRSCQRLRKADQSMTTMQWLQSRLAGIWSI